MIIYIYLRLIFNSLTKKATKDQKPNKPQKRFLVFNLVLVINLPGYIAPNVSSKWQAL